MEKQLGHDFSRVRIHTNTQAGESARQLNALGFAVGRNIVFGSGRYSPTSESGRALLAHELTHVAQQSGRETVPENLIMTSENDPTEREAEAVERSFLSGAPTGFIAQSDVRLARQELGNSEDFVKPTPETDPVLVSPAPSAKQSGKKGKVLTYEEVETHVKSSNNSSLSTELLICLIWKESGFKPESKNPGSSATGLMQITKGAITDVNRNTPKGIHFSHAEMTDPAKNISCGTYYLKILLERWGKQTKALDSFGTGSGYSDDIVKCEGCLPKATAETKSSCLAAIHG